MIPIFRTHRGQRLSVEPPLTGEPAQASLRGRPRGRFGSVGSGKGCDTMPIVVYW